MSYGIVIGSSRTPAISECPLFHVIGRDRAVAAALRMRDAMRKFNSGRSSDELLVKIGIHEGPCLAVTLHDRQDYFGQTVNMASRMQRLATTRSIFVTKSVIEDPQAAMILAHARLNAVVQQAASRGIADTTLVYEIPYLSL